MWFVSPGLSCHDVAAEERGIRLLRWCTSLWVLPVVFLVTSVSSPCCLPLNLSVGSPCFFFHPCPPCRDLRPYHGCACPRHGLRPVSGSGHADGEWCARRRFQSAGRRTVVHHNPPFLRFAALHTGTCTLATLGAAVLTPLTLSLAFMRERRAPRLRPATIRLSYIVSAPLLHCHCLAATCVSSCAGPA